MKIMNLPFLRHKLQWFLLLVAMLTVSQGVWANGSAAGPKGVYLTVNSSDTWYNVYSCDWGYSPSCSGYNTFKSATSISGVNLGTVTTLKIKGFAVIGWTDNSDWVSGQLRWKVDSGSYSYYKVGNYGNCGGGVTNVVCTSGNDRVVGYNASTNVDVLSGLGVGSHTLYLKPYGQMLYNCGDFNSVDHTELSCTFTVPGWATTSGTTTWSSSVCVGSSDTKSSISLGTHYGSKSTATAELTSGNTGDFTINSCSASTISVTFTPTTTGTRTATITITDAYSKTRTLTVTGTGKAIPSLTDVSGPTTLSAATASAGTYTTQSVTGGTYHWASTITGLVLSTGDPLATATTNSITVTTGATTESGKEISVYVTKDGCNSNTVKLTGISVSSCSAASVTVVTPNTAQTKSLPTSSATPSVAQAVTATYSGGNQIGWTVTPSTISGYTAATFDDASSSSTNLNMNYEGEYTATFGAGCGNTTDATLTTAKITVEPSEIYLAGPLFDGGSVWATNHKMTKGSTSFYYDWNAARTTGEFTLRTSNSASEPAYVIPNYAKNNYTGITAASSGNHNLSVSGVSFAVGDKVRVTAKYKGWNASEGKPEYDITFTKRCSYPTEGSLTAPGNVCSGENFTITLAGHTATNTTISWRKRVYDGSAYGSWAVIEGETGTSLTISQTAQTQYKARVTTTSGGCYKETTAVTVNMYANSSVSNVTLSSGSVCIGESGITASATKTLGKGEGAWSSSNTIVATVTSGGAITARAAGSANIIYTITGGCNGTVSNYAALTVNPNMSVAGVSVSLDNDDVCLGATPTASKSGSEVLGGGTAQFISSDPTVATVNATTGAISTLKAGTTNITYMVSGGCGSNVETDPAGLTVKAKPTLTKTPSGTTSPYQPITFTSDMDADTSLENKGWSSTNDESTSYFVSKGTRTAVYKRGSTSSARVWVIATNGCQSNQYFFTQTADSETCE